MGYGMNVMLLAKEVDFFIHLLLPYKFFGQEVYLTSTHISTFIVMVSMIVLALLARRKLLKDAEVPTGVQNLVEMIVEMIGKYTASLLGKHNVRYLNYLGTVILFIFLSNASGLFGLRAPTADYGTTLALALFTFFIIHYTNIKDNKWRAFTDIFEPLWPFFPLNIISIVTTPLSLSLRLYGNMLSGIVMMTLWGALLPTFARFGFPVFINIYSDIFIAGIQTYVFTMLSMVFISQKLST